MERATETAILLAIFAGVITTVLVRLSNSQKRKGDEVSRTAAEPTKSIPSPLPDVPDSFSESNHCYDKKIVVRAFQEQVLKTPFSKVPLGAWFCAWMGSESTTTGDLVNRIRERQNNPTRLKLSTEGIGEKPSVGLLLAGRWVGNVLPGYGMQQLGMEIALGKPCLVDRIRVIYHGGSYLDLEVILFPASEKARVELSDPERWQIAPSLEDLWLGLDDETGEKLARDKSGRWETHLRSDQRFLFRIDETSAGCNVITGREFSSKRYVAMKQTKAPKALEEAFRIWFSSSTASGRIMKQHLLHRFPDLAEERGVVLVEDQCFDTIWEANVQDENARRNVRYREGARNHLTIGYGRHVDRCWNDGQRALPFSTFCAEQTNLWSYYIMLEKTAGLELEENWEVENDASDWDLESFKTDEDGVPLDEPVNRF